MISVMSLLVGVAQEITSCDTDIAHWRICWHVDWKVIVEFTGLAFGYLVMASGPEAFEMILV
jgi:hypothetical protein